jgi:N utilization substance protein B
MAQTHDKVFHSRRTTRVAALQTLCEIDSVDHTLDEVLTHARQSWSISGPAGRFLDRLAGGVLENIGEIDKIISEFAPSWPISQMAIVDRNLLRMGIYEISMGSGTPPKVAINEAVEMAKAFGSESSPRFVNGVLGAVMQTVASQVVSPASQPIGDSIYILKE